MNYYNEFDPFAADWLKELIKEGLIPEGVVDDRSIADVDPDDIREFKQCHFFAGIGGWSLALKLAGWPSDRPVWTGSPPCQPFSVAGKEQGKSDERHLWPTFFNLINQCKPSTVFGEQVASAIRHEWFDDLQADLEREGYAAGMVVLPACSVNAPHKRDRIIYVGHAISEGLEGHPGNGDSLNGQEWKEASKSGSATETSVPSSSLGNADYNRCEPRGKASAPTGLRNSNDSASWDDCRRIQTSDGKYRVVPAESSLFPLANGLPNRVGILRGAGNAIVPQVAAEVVKAYMETLGI